MNKFKLAMMVIMFLFFASTALAMQGTTQQDYIACFAKSDLDDVISFVSAKDLASIDAYRRQNKCIMLKEGLTVTVTKSPGMFGGYVEFVYRGIKLWTVREALKNYR